MKLFTGLKKIREFERLQLPFLKSVVDFDIVIEIGYAEEQGQPLTLKQLFLLNFGSRTTVRRIVAVTTNGAPYDPHQAIRSDAETSAVPIDRPDAQIAEEIKRRQISLAVRYVAALRAR